MTRKSPPLERIAEAHFFIRPTLRKCLESYALTDDARAYLGQSYDNYYELWTRQYSDKFHDMTTMIRLGGAIEEELRKLYMRMKGHANLQSLKEDPDYRQGAFQRIMPWQTRKNDAQHMLRLAGYNICANTQLIEAQRTMLHRHLYAHNLGLIDEKYIVDWKRLTNEDIQPIAAHDGYPSEDVYWFPPLEKLSTTIENLRQFVRELP